MSGEGEDAVAHEFCIILFSEEEDLVECVPTIWLKGTSECYWPQSKNAAQLIKRKQEPGPDWGLCPVQVLHYAETWAAGKLKVNQYLLSTDEEPTRRKRFVPKRLTTEDSESESEPSPPCKKSRPVVQPYSFRSPRKASPRKVSPRKASPRKVSPRKASPRETPSRQETNSSEELSPVSTPRSRQTPGTGMRELSPVSQTPLSAGTGMRADQNCCSHCTKNTDLLKAVLRELKLLGLRLSDAIPRGGASEAPTPVHPILEGLPCSTVEQWAEKVASMSDQGSYSALVQEITRTYKNTASLAGMVRVSLRRLLDDNVSKFYNLIGTEGKAALQDVAIRAIVDGILLKNSHISREAVKSQLGEFLRQNSNRKRKQALAASRVASTVTIKPSYIEAIGQEEESIVLEVLN